MYIPDHFSPKDEQEAIDFIRSHPFGILISTHDGRPWGSHLPFELTTNKHGKQVLLTHMAKANAQWTSLDNNTEVMAIFTGAHSYVSASWYSIEEVSTWNYSAVHAYGRYRKLSMEELDAMLHRLMEHYEAPMEAPVKLDELSKATRNQIYGVVGIEIEITELQPVFKLSQNRSEKDHSNVRDKLLASGDPNATQVALDMKENRDKNKE